MSLEEVGKHIKKWQENKKNEEQEIESDEGTTRSWKEEKQKLVRKLKNPLMDSDEEGGDAESEGSEEASDITKSADDAFTKVVDTVTTSSQVQKLKKSQEKDVKEVRKCLGMFFGFSQSKQVLYLSTDKKYPSKVS